jgi:hypothetical protein
MSSLALFLVLAGGSAFAASQLAKNSVGTKQLKKNAVTAAKLKKNAVTAAKIKKNAITTAKLRNSAVTGAKIDESSLGQVPLAENATNAVNAQNFSRYFNFGLKKAKVGETEIPLGQIGPFTFVADCVDQGGGSYLAETYVKSSVAGAAAYSYEDSYYWDLDPGERAPIGYEVSSTEPYGYFYDYYDAWGAASPDGSTMLSGEAKPMVHVLGADCAFLVYGFNNTP